MYLHPFHFDGFSFYPSYLINEKLIAKEKRKTRNPSSKKKRSISKNKDKGKTTKWNTDDTD